MKWGGIFIGISILSCDALMSLIILLNTPTWSDYLEYFFSREYLLVTVGMVLFFCLMIFSLTQKWMPFVRLSEKVFRALNLPDPDNIDLVKSSKAQRKPSDPGEFGTFYFR
jgi:hypothetical protein